LSSWRIHLLVQKLVSDDALVEESSFRVQIERIEFYVHGCDMGALGAVELAWSAGWMAGVAGVQ